MLATVLNSTSYFGLELCKLLSLHPKFDIYQLTARSNAGRKFGQVFPHVAAFNVGSKLADIRLMDTEEVDVRNTGIVFSCLPHTASANALKPFIDAGVRAIDVSADLRLYSAVEYERRYGAKHPLPELLCETVYGLPELHRDEIGSAKYVGNPGCYPTAALLSAAPALTHGLVEPEFIFDAKSGISGAGRSLKLDSHFSEVAESTHAYGVDGHRHLAEISQELERIAGRQVNVTFIPHLTPMIRGILSTGYARLKKPVDPEQLNAIYSDFFSDSPFVLICDQPPRTKWVTGSNICAVHARLSENGRYLLMFGAIDNLVRGAAGQAVACANLMCGIGEREGLGLAPSYP